MTVLTTSVADILQEQKFDKFALICDIEGQEYEMIMREPRAIEKAQLIIMEVHPHILGEDKVQLMISKLIALNFEVIDRSTNVVIFRKAA